MVVSMKMARLNKELIQQRAREIGSVENANQFQEFMGWTSPTKAARFYHATTTKPELDSIEDVAFKLNLSLHSLILPSGKRGRKQWPEG